MRQNDAILGCRVREDGLVMHTAEVDRLDPRRIEIGDSSAKAAENVVV